MRTDTQRLDFLLQVMEQQDEAAAERIQGAFMLDLKGRTALDAAMGAKVIEPGEPMPALTAIDLATAELGRIRNVKGFNEERDDGYTGGELAKAAVCYLLGATEVVPFSLGESVDLWPWPAGYFKPSPDDRKKEMTKGIALAVCELDRLIRAERREAIGAGHDCEAQVCAEMNAAACEPEDVQPQPRKFKIGDRVRIISNAQDNPWGWCAEMDELVGSSGAITRVFGEPGYEVSGLIYPASQLACVND